MSTCVKGECDTLERPLKVICSESCDFQTFGIKVPECNVKIHIQGHASGVSDSGSHAQGWILN